MPSTISPLNLPQKAFLLTKESNRAGDIQEDAGALATKLQDHLKTFLSKPDIQKAMEGQWSVVWGPAVFQDTQSGSRYADNVMYVAASPDQSTYVVAIAGTNGSSDYDKNQEDNGVNTTKLWIDAFPSLKPYGVPSGINPWPALSTGTALGVNNLLNMTDSLTTQKSLLDFLKSLSATGSKTLIFGGHSLGGALAPTLALALFNPSGGPLSISNWGHVYVLPVAGPTPGNKGLSQFFGQVFPPVSLNVPQLPRFAWNQDIWNTLDAVPHAWVVDMLGQIPSLYPSNWDGGKVPSDITNMVTGAIALSLAGGALPGAYTQLPNIPVPGTFQGTAPVHDEATFFAQVGYQHLDAYLILFNIQELISEDSRNAGPRILQRWLASIPRAATPSKSRAAAAR
jgi:hypothetical protein